MDETQINCHQCNRLLARGDLEGVYWLEYISHYLCNSCYDNEGSYCDNCNEYFYTSDLTWCNDCSEYYCSSECSSEHSCFQDNDNDSSYDFRDKLYAQTSKYDLPFKEGELIKSSRSFGIEIECYYSDPDDLKTFFKDIPPELGYCKDGSLGHNGIELKTPVMSGQLGENFIKKLATQLDDNSFYVDRSCGLHLHLSMPEYAYIDDMKKDKAIYPIYERILRLWKFYIAFDDVILSFLPSSRRNNNYCVPIREFYHLFELNTSSNLNDLEKIWYRLSNARDIARLKSDKQHQSRYRGINLHSLFASQNLEIRYHSGTLDAKKILYWLVLHQAITDICTDDVKSLIEFTVDKSKKTLTLTDKTRLFFSVLTLDDKIKNYFLTRQAKFTPSLADEKQLCAV